MERTGGGFKAKKCAKYLEVAQLVTQHLPQQRHRTKMSAVLGVGGQYGKSCSVDSAVTLSAQSLSHLTVQSADEHGLLDLFLNRRQLLSCQLGTLGPWSMYFRRPACRFNPKVLQDDTAKFPKQGIVEY